VRVPPLNLWASTKDVAGQLKEERYILEPGTYFRRSRLIRQARLRDPDTGTIIKVYPEEVLKHRV